MIQSKKRRKRLTIIFWRWVKIERLRSIVSEVADFQFRNPRRCMEFTRDDLRIGDLLAPEFMELLDQKRAPEARDALLDLLDPQIADVLIALPAQPMAVIFRLLPRNR